VSKALSLLKKRKGRFVGIPYEVAKNHLFAELTPPQTKLLIDLSFQYNGKNNGMLSACHALMKKRGWARASLYRAFSGLQHAGFVVVTRQGWKRRGKPTLVAITWSEIDDPTNGVRYDDGIKTSPTALNYWCKAKAGWKHQPKTKDLRKIQSSKLKETTRSSYSKLKLVN
jgi:hypothetical protein